MSALRIVRQGSDDQHYPKASLFLRAGARLVDVAVAWLLFKSTGPAGIVMALLYILFADAMIQGQSVGKKLFGVKAVFLPTRQAVRHRDSVLRNAPFGLVIILYMMPDLGLTAFFGGVAVIGAIEAVRTIRDPDGVRWGDLWAQTQVIDGKELANGAELIRSEPQEARATGRAGRSTTEQH